MEFPSELRETIEALASEYPLSELIAAAGGLSSRYRGVRNGGRLARSPIDIIAYAASRMPATFGACARALKLTAETLPEGTELSSVLDIGAGTGAASHAAQLVLGCRVFTCAEREPEMIKTGKILSEARGMSAEWVRGDIEEGMNLRADLVICSYCLNELSPDAMIKTAGELLDAAEKLLLIIEPGTPDGFARIKSVREALIGMGARIAAPCPSDSPCGLPPGDWCHFTCRVARGRLHKRLKGGDSPYEDEKFCFIAAFKGEPRRAEARVLRHPRTDSGRIGLRLCSADGITDRQYTRKDALFKAARKAENGDGFPRG